MLRALACVVLLCTASACIAADPSEPRNLTGTQVGQGPTVVLHWQQPATWSQIRIGYIISMRDLANPNSSMIIATAGPNATSLNTGLSSDYTYILRVQAVSFRNWSLHIGPPASVTINAP